MNPKIPTIITIIIAVLTLFFFPSPQENFIYYIGTIALFTILIIFIYKKSKKMRTSK